MNHIDHTHALGFTKRLTKIQPRIIENDFGLFNVFDVSRKHYLEEEIERNREKAEAYCRRLKRVAHQSQINFEQNLTEI